MFFWVNNFFGILSFLCFARFRLFPFVFPFVPVFFPFCFARFRFSPFLFPLISFFRLIFSRFWFLCLLRCHVCITSSCNSCEICLLYCRCCLFPFAHSIDGHDICAGVNCTKIMRLKVGNFSETLHGFLCDDCMIFYRKKSKPKKRRSMAWWLLGCVKSGFSLYAWVGPALTLKKLWYPRTI